jgi:hypothetical protein
MAKVLVGVPTAEGARHANFYDYYNALDRPEGTLHMFARGQSPARGRNMIIQAAIDNDCTHIFFLDDDVIPQPDIINRLLAHDKDVVTGLYAMRDFPHFPVAFDKRFPNGFNRHVHLNGDVDGLVEITNCGLGCVLIKMDVFNKVPKPWITLGELESDGWCDDIAFFNKVGDAGIKMYCDTNVLVDHMMTVNVGYRKVDGVWAINYDVRGKGNCQFPISYPAADVDMAKRIEGWMSDKELEFLGIVAKNHEYLFEVGSYKGKSARVMADNTKGKLICIDTWNSIVHSNDGRVIYKTSDDTYADFEKNLKEHIDSGKVIPYRMDYQKYEPNGFQPDFIFIDAAHDYESVKLDIEKSMSMNPKIIAGHDYDSKVWPGVVKAVDERFGEVNHVDTIWWKEND